MSETGSGSTEAPQPGTSGNAAEPRPRASFWLRELPYGVLLLLTVFGVAYVSYPKQSTAGFWDVLAPAIAACCVAAGWLHACDGAARWRLIWTQALHWLAFVVAMNLMLLPSVQRVLPADASGLAILALLALGTFTAGVHILAWQVCLLGIVMALGVPAIAWVEQSTLFLTLITVAVLTIGAVAFAVLWRARKRRAARHATVTNSHPNRATPGSRLSGTPDHGQPA